MKPHPNFKLIITNLTSFLTNKGAFLLFSDLGTTPSISWHSGELQCYSGERNNNNNNEAENKLHNLKTKKS